MKVPFVANPEFIQTKSAHGRLKEKKVIYRKVKVAGKLSRFMEASEALTCCGRSPGAWPLSPKVT